MQCRMTNACAMVFCLLSTRTHHFLSFLTCSIIKARKAKKCNTMCACLERLVKFFCRDSFSHVKCNAMCACLERLVNFFLQRLILTCSKSKLARRVLGYMRFLLPVLWIQNQHNIMVGSQLEVTNLALILGLYWIMCHSLGHSKRILHVIQYHRDITKNGV